jgi:uncharacterized protein
MKTRELTFKPELEEIIKKCQSCSLSMADEKAMPYVLPMNFGYDKDVIYFHSSKKGKKIDILKQNPNVCVCFTTDHALDYVNEEVACSWSMKYRSVLAYGKVKFVEDYDEKLTALKHIMGNYSEREFKFNKPAVVDVQVFTVAIEKIEGRAYGF